MEGKWFRTKRYGWGWTPNTWQGWMTLLVFFGLVFLNAYRLHVIRPETTAVTSEFVIETFLLVIILLLICFIKGESPAWHWGDN